MKPLSIICLLMCAQCAHAYETASEQIAERMFAQMAQDDGMPVFPDAYVNEHPEHGMSPLQSGWLHDRCILVINMRGNEDAMHALTAYAFPYALILRTVLAHELGHCWQTQRGEKAGSHEGELNADVYALTWTRKNHPEDYEQAFAYLKALRAHTTRGNDTHATEAELERAMQ